jgi:signal transduction histidine kinase
MAAAWGATLASSSPAWGNMFVAFGVVVWMVIVDELLPPLVEQPPPELQRWVSALAVVASVALTLRMMWVDALRLRQSLARAEQAVATRDEFISVASHELKTPLTPLSLKLHALRREFSAPSPPSPERGLVHIELAQRQVKKLVELVEDLLDVSRIGAGQLELHPEKVELGALVREVMERFEPEAARAGYALELEAAQPLMAWVDGFRFQQVLDNLLSNALNISRQIVESSGGTIVASSAPGQGSTFTVELPMAQEESASAVSTSPSAGSRPRRS